MGESKEEVAVSSSSAGSKRSMAKSEKVTSRSFEDEILWGDNPNKSYFAFFLENERMVRGNESILGESTQEDLFATPHLQLDTEWMQMTRSRATMDDITDHRSRSHHRLTIPPEEPSHERVITLKAPDPPPIQQEEMPPPPGAIRPRTGVDVPSVIYVGPRPQHIIRNGKGDSSFTRTSFLEITQNRKAIVLLLALLITVIVGFSTALLVVTLRTRDDPAPTDGGSQNGPFPQSPPSSMFVPTPVVLPPPPPPPTPQPTVSPTPTPTPQPTFDPTQQKREEPSLSPSWAISMDPTLPNSVPTGRASPSGPITKTPSVFPSRMPSNRPTTATPTPTAIPTAIPTAMPTAIPTAMPTVIPTVIPTTMPTVRSSASPSSKQPVTSAPVTNAPSSNQPVTNMPVKTAPVTPTPRPTLAKTAVPSHKPTMLPTSAALQQLQQFLSEVVPDQEAPFSDMFSPQSQALEWLAAEPDLSSYSGLKKLQRFVLATLYFSTSGSLWTRSDNWLTDADECSWHSGLDDPFVPCSDQGQLTNLDLRSNGLKGSIPPELGLLKDTIKRLHMPSNQLTGTIPSELGLLTKLERLQISDNNLVGTIPIELGDLTSVDILNLERTQLTGNLPSQVCNLRTDASLQVLTAPCSVICSCCTSCS